MLSGMSDQWFELALALILSSTTVRLVWGWRRRDRARRLDSLHPPGRDVLSSGLILLFWCCLMFGGVGESQFFLCQAQTICTWWHDWNQSEISELFLCRTWPAITEFQAQMLQRNQCILLLSGGGLGWRDKETDEMLLSVIKSTLVQSKMDFHIYWVQQLTRVSDYKCLTYSCSFERLCSI